MKGNGDHLVVIEFDPCAALTLASTPLAPRCGGLRDLAPCCGMHAPKPLDALRFADLDAASGGPFSASAGAMALPGTTVRSL